jgi:predicted nuclease with RNAse H fold
MPDLSREELVVVYEATDQFMSWAVRQQLEEAGIPVVEHVDRSPYAMDWLSATSNYRNRYSRLLTPQSCAAQARTIIADFLAAYERGELEVPREGGP